ncbi:hypothetical protein NSQ43_15805 [Sporosarcina sp. FSL W8-0480]|uniref:hypothetical protein n=1 Tax=Sporosarcina sp. FSL W8-0480 TaxID=2954701 RepID=UPI0030D9CABE
MKEVIDVLQVKLNLSITEIINELLHPALCNCNKPLACFERVKKQLSRFRTQFKYEDISSKRNSHVFLNICTSILENLSSLQEEGKSGTIKQGVFKNKNASTIQEVYWRIKAIYEKAMSCKDGGIQIQSENMNDGDYMPKTKINTLIGEINDFLGKVPFSGIDDLYDVMEENEESWNDYIYFKKYADFHFLIEDYTRSSYLILATFNKVWCFQTSNSYDSQVLEFEKMEDAIQFLLASLNDIPEFILTDLEETVSYDISIGKLEKTVTIHFETLKSFAEKIDYLISG